jgi:hypothetical protein
LISSHFLDLHRSTPTLKELQNEILDMKKRHTEYPATSALRDRLKKEAEYADYNRYTKLTELLWYALFLFLISFSCYCYSLFFIS